MFQVDREENQDSLSLPLPFFPSLVRFPLYQHINILDPDSYPIKRNTVYIYIYVYEYIYLICNLSLLFFVEV